MQSGQGEGDSNSLIDKLKERLKGSAWRGYMRPESYPSRMAELAPGKRILIGYANRPALPTDLVSANNIAGLYAKRTQNGATQHVLLAIASTLPAASITLADRKTALKDLGEQTYFFLAILEEIAPDTGKAELKPESKPQLDAMAEMLKANPAFQV